MNLTAFYSTVRKYDDLMLESSTSSISDEADDSDSDIELSDVSKNDDSESNIASVDPELSQISLANLERMFFLQQKKNKHLCAKYQHSSAL